MAQVGATKSHADCPMQQSCRDRKPRAIGQESTAHQLVTRDEVMRGGGRGVLIRVFIACACAATTERKGEAPSSAPSCVRLAYSLPQTAPSARPVPPPSSSLRSAQVVQMRDALSPRRHCRPRSPKLSEPNAAMREPSPGADVGGVSRVPAQTREGAVLVPPAHIECHRAVPPSSATR